MDTYYLSTPQLLGIEAEVTGSEYTFIQRGLNFLLHGNGTEGILLLAQAHAQLTAKKSQLVGLLEAAINACAKLDQAQEALLDASRDYAKAEAEREAQLSSLACVLGAQNVQNSILPSPIDLLHHRSDDRRDDQGYSPTIGAITGPLPLSSSKASSNDLLPALSIACFGRFIVRRGGQVLELCRSRNGQAILRYLVAQPGYRASADALMEAFWAGEEPDIARRKLQVAVSALFAQSRLRLRPWRRLHHL